MTVKKKEKERVAGEVRGKSLISEKKEIQKVQKREREKGQRVPRRDQVRAELRLSCWGLPQVFVQLWICWRGLCVVVSRKERR